MPRQRQPDDQPEPTQVDTDEPEVPKPDGEEDLDANGDPLAAESSTESPEDAV